MPRLRTQFGGLNTDDPPVKLPSGTATEAVNVTVSGRKLAKRPGFAVYEADVSDGSSTPILGLFIARLANGDVYVMAKCGDGDGDDDGKLYQRRVYATAATGFTEIACEQTIDDSNMGWSFHFADRFHYFDANGGTRWHPDHLSTDDKAFKAGYPRPTVGPTIAVANYGEKDGHYHVVYAWRNSGTEEEGQVSPPSVTAAGNTYLTVAMRTNGGITVPTATQPTAYEIDTVHCYCSLGNTEAAQRGTTDVELFSYKYYSDAIGTTPVGLNKHDDVLDPETLFTNQGGEPNGALCGCFTGRYGIYGGVHVSGTLDPDMLEYSKPNYPTSIPRPVSYSAGKLQGTGLYDVKTVNARPWNGQIVSDFAGGIVEIAFSGGTVAVYGPAAAWQMRVASDGQLVPIRVMEMGCVAHGAAVGVNGEVHALAYRAWRVMSTRSHRNIAQDRFTTTLQEIPAAYQSSARMAYYSWRNQVWAAVVKSGATVAQRILILDYSASAQGELTIFEPANLGATESITCLCELACPGADPTMLVGTNLGRILQYPGSSTQITDAGTDFAANWKGIFAAERAQYRQKLEGIDVHAGASCRDRVRWGFRCKRTGGDTPNQQTGYLYRDESICTMPCLADNVDGRLFEIEFSSAAEATAADAVTWEIDDMALIVGRTDKA